jgi:hypothetical protein
MKEFVDIHNYMVSVEVVGDWEGQEETVVENLNELYHTLYHLAEEDISSEQLELLLDVVWEHWIGQEELADLQTEEILDWCHYVLANREQFLDQN